MINIWRWQLVNDASLETRRRMGTLKRSHELIGPLCIRQGNRDVLQDGYNRIGMIYLRVRVYDKK